MVVKLLLFDNPRVFDRRRVVPAPPPPLHPFVFDPLVEVLIFKLISVGPTLVEIDVILFVFKLMNLSLLAFVDVD